METQLRKVLICLSILAGGLVATVCLICVPTYCGYISMTFPWDNGMMDEHKVNDSLSRWACYEMVGRIMKTNMNVVAGFNLWEDRKYFWLESAESHRIWYDRTIGTGSIQVRKKDGMWRRNSDKWKSGGYVHITVDELTKTIAHAPDIDDIERRFGSLYRNTRGGVLLETGGVFQGAIVTNRCCLRTNDGYGLYRYDCINGAVDVVTSERKVVWCAAVKERPL
jgi:hypothetical protein